MTRDKPAEDPRRTERRWVTGVAVVFGVLAVASAFSQRVENLVGYVLIGAVVLTVLFGVVRHVLGELDVARVCKGPVSPPDLTPRYWPGSVKDRAQRGMPPKDDPPMLRVVDEDD